MANRKSSDLSLQIAYQMNVSDQISRGTYNLTIGLSVAVGLLINLVMAQVFGGAIAKIPVLAILIIYLAGSIGAVVLMSRAQTPSSGLIGFLILSICTGLLLTNIVSVYTKSSITVAFLLTMVITVLMVIAGTLFPAFFMKLQTMLLVTLGVTLIVEIIAGLFFRKYLVVTDYIIVAVFAGFIGVDWGRAQARPLTMPNAFFSAASIYMDIINIFIRLLAILGKRD